MPQIHVSLFLFLIASRSFAQNNDDSILWKENIKLKWSYFMAPSNVYNNHAAHTYCIIDYALRPTKDSLKCDVQTKFLKSKSWVKKKDENENLLQHEQGHFDIREIYTRMLRKKIKESKFHRNNLQEEFDHLESEIHVELDLKQEEYDKETNFSINQEKQNEWIKKIAVELKGLKDFENTEVVVPLKN